MKVSREIKEMSELILNTFDPERLKSMTIEKV